MQPLGKFPIPGNLQIGDKPALGYAEAGLRGGRAMALAKLKFPIILFGAA